MNCMHTVDLDHIDFPASPDYLVQKSIHFHFRHE